MWEGHGPTMKYHHFRHCFAKAVTNERPLGCVGPQGSAPRVKVMFWSFSCWDDGLVTLGEYFEAMSWVHWVWRVLHWGNWS